MKDHKIQIATSVPISIVDALDEIAERAGKSRSATMARIVREYVEGQAAPVQTAREKIDAAFAEVERTVKVTRGLPASMASLPSADDDHPYDHDTQLPEDIFFCWCGVSRDLHGTPENEI